MYMYIIRIYRTNSSFNLYSHFIVLKIKIKILKILNDIYDAFGNVSFFLLKACDRMEKKLNLYFLRVENYLQESMNNA